MEASMQKPNDLNQSRIVLKQDSTLIAVIEMSLSSWPSLGPPALAAVKQISILHSGFPNRTPIHLLIEALRELGYKDSNTAAMNYLAGKETPNGWTCAIPRSDRDVSLDHLTAPQRPLSGRIMGPRT
jgi:hypothetical protein